MKVEMDPAREENNVELEGGRTSVELGAANVDARICLSCKSSQKALI